MQALSEYDERYEEDCADTSASDQRLISTTFYRWPVLLTLAANISLNSMVYMGTAPVAPAIREAYGLSSDFWPNFVQMLFPMFTLMMSPLAIYLYKEQQVSNQLRLAAVAFAAGAWLRYGISESGNFLYVAAGSALIASASPFFIIS